MLYPVRVVTAPDVEPVSLEEAKTWLRIDPDLDADNDLVAGLITAARVRAELETQRALVTQTLEATADWFPDGDYAIILPRPPLQSVTSVTYTDADDVSQTFTDFAADIRREPGRVYPVYGELWPTTLRQMPGVIAVRFVAGYGAAAAVPEDLKLAIKFMVSAWYGKRNEGDVPEVARSLLRGYWVGNYPGPVDQRERPWWTRAG